MIARKRLYFNTIIIKNIARLYVGNTVIIKT